MGKYIFLKLSTEDSRKTLHALPGQQQSVKDGNAVELNAGEAIAADNNILSEYSADTVFAVPSEELWTIGDGHYAGDIRPLVNEYLLHDSAVKAPQEAFDEYEAFKKSLPRQEEQAKAPEKKTSKASRKKAKTFFEILERAFPMPSLEDCGFYIDPENWKMLVRNVVKGKNTLLYGPSGCGKTELVRTVGRVMNLPVTIIHMNNITDPETQLCGTLRMDAARNVYFDYAEFALAIQKPGIVLLDEINRACPDANNALLGVLDGSRTLMAATAGEGERRQIPVHRDCTFLATANIGGAFVNTYKIDPATQSRFFPMELKHLDSSSEASVLEKVCGIGRNQAENIVEIADEIRRSFRERILKTEISTRETIEVAELVKDGMSVSDAYKARILPLYESDGSDGDQRDIVRCHVTDKARC